MVVNLHDETKKAVGEKTIAYARIKVRNDIFDEVVKKVWLKPDYNEEELREFWNNLYLSYDNCYGTQYVLGFIVFTDETWIERTEYDGSECWEHKRKPIFTDWV